MVFFYDAETYRGLTTSAPQSTSYPKQWPPFIKEAKLLYVKQNYKRCAIQCEKMLQEQSGRLQPLHETFLHFFIAICNESLALASHKFSSKKLSFLQLAKDSFTAALVGLPLLPATHRSGSDEAPPFFSSHSPGLDQSRAHHDEENNRSQFSGQAISLSRHRTSGTKKSLDERCDSGYDSGRESVPLCGDDGVPDFNNYTARRPLVDLLSLTDSSAQPSPDKEDFGNVSLKDDYLIPKPLFVKKTATASKDTSSSCQLLPPPLNLRGSQQQKGDIAPSAAASNTPSSTTCQDYIEKRQQQQEPFQHLLTTKYNTDLSLFHDQLSQHLSFIDHTIATTTHLQQQHRLNQSKRVASFWSFQPVLGSTAEDEDDANASEKKERIEKLRCSGWSVTKERHGWKGEAFYEELRGLALAELSS